MLNGYVFEIIVDEETVDYFEALFRFHPGE